ncbi:TonB-dependent receptor [Alistipes sp. UBA6068]|jgi:TonB-linked SusC/RagA family outer membrane protein|uniref:SusC/RagA family TonB-linked outer membrane protein n=1 Tax=unclassified Alistipes TaxID=2608932 RepID=UPI0025947CAE|nr:TonB-dependent receptor [Alistipes sp. UBA6068]
MKKLLTQLHSQWLLLAGLVLLSPGLVSAQNAGGGNFTFSGEVYADGEPLIGATVTEPGTSNGTVTGAGGAFSLRLSRRGAEVQVSFIGYETRTLRAQADRLRIDLVADAQQIDEVMVVAYGTMKKRDITGAVTSLSEEAIERKMASNVFEAMQGQVAGVHITAGSGQPGESASVNVRGISTFSAEGVKPLFVVDGIPMEDIDGINTSDILSVEVLKDAASAAMYGSRSANGVFIITTKGGSVSAPRVEVKYYHSWGKLSHKLAQATRADRRNYDLKRRAFFLENKIGTPDESFMIIQDSLNASFNIDNDYQDILFQWGQKDQVDLSVSGGSDKIKYYGSTGYYNERGIVPNTGFQRLTARLNADYNANSWLTLHSRVSLGYSQKNGINEGQLMTAMLSRRPYFNLYYPDGSLAGVFQGQKSPLAQVEYTTDRTEYYKVNFYQGFEVRLAKGLTFSTNINANLYLDKRRRVYPSMITDEWQKSNTGYSNDNLNWNWLNENVLTYKNSWGGHNFTAMVGFSEQQWRYDRNVLSGINSSSDFLTTMNAFSANLILSETGAWQQNHAMASLFARVNYDYKSRYLVQATVRRDGSSRFSKKNRWGNFPSVSAAWRLSDEPFMKFSRRVLDDAKIRVSWGVTGNEQIGNYDYLYSYTTGDIYDGIGGVYPARLAVDNLRWEETRQTDVGLDLSFFGQRLTLTADYYDKYTDGLLANLELPKESGFGSMRTNIGEVRNRGFELSVAGDLVRTRDFRWNASFNISRNWNSIERLSTGEPYLEGDLWWMQEGGSVGDFYGYRQLGIFRYDQSNAFTPDTWQQLTPVFEGGEFRGYTLNGQAYTGDVVQKKLPNGKPFRGGDINWDEAPGSRDGVIDENDRMVLGNALPTYTGGLSTTFTYKNVSLFVSFYYSFGAKIYNDAEHQRNMFKYSSTTPSPHVINNIWVHQGDEALYPRPYNDEFNNARYANSFYLEKGDFIRLQNIRLSYDLPERWLKPVRIKSLQVYFFANNPLTWTAYSGYDPEFSSANPLRIGKDTYRYPHKREFGAGLNVKF